MAVAAPALALCGVETKKKRLEEITAEEIGRAKRRIAVQVETPLPHEHQPVAFPIDAGLTHEPRAHEGETSHARGFRD